ncbi:four helix bundle protein [Pedobacter sp. SL55]|uniref:four helix bundle protein n=1 Tax=Pedobacter sp. SL55 TaxID=2995161 RepID=UPI00226FAD4F|nr:four helix bundle protein [Pedobacter sp. SL55]WAC41911.1 four helix bundle protein [Pedobacter sp. SL55]
MQNYKELKVWEKPHQLVLEIYRLTAKFPKEEIFGVTSQIRRAAASIPANIAEGCGKKSQLDFANFLNISLGSANETDYFLLLCRDLNYISETEFLELENTINAIKAMLINLITKVRSK